MYCKYLYTLICRPLQLSGCTGSMSIRHAGNTNFTAQQGQADQRFEFDIQN